MCNFAARDAAFPFVGNSKKESCPNEKPALAVFAYNRKTYPLPGKGSKALDARFVMFYGFDVFIKWVIILTNSL